MGVPFPVGTDTGRTLRNSAPRTLELAFDLRLVPTLCVLGDGLSHLGLPERVPESFKGEGGAGEAGEPPKEGTGQ